MTFFDWFMAIVGITNLVSTLLWVACEVKPSIRRNKNINEFYKFFVGYDDHFIRD